MHYREKIAWLTLASMLVAYTIYFGKIAGGHPAGEDKFAMLWLFGTIAALQAVFVIIVTIVIALTAPNEAEQKADERDRAIAHRSTFYAYFLLMTGMILVGVMMPFGAGGVQIVNAALFMLVISETVRHIVILLSYRRGWHG